jgi:hypothetical protein
LRFKKLIGLGLDIQSVFTGGSNGYELSSPFLEDAYTGGERAPAHKLDKKKLLQQIINDGLLIVKKIKYTDVKKTNYISMDNVKLIFLKAYRWILNINFAKSQIDNEQYLIQNSILYYLIFAYNMSNPKTPIMNKEPNIFTITEKDKSQLKNILGRDYGKVNDEISLLNKSIFETIPEIKVLGKTADGFNMVYDYIKDQLFLERVAPQSEALTKWIEKYKFLHEQEYNNKMTNKLGVMHLILRI